MTMKPRTIALTTALLLLVGAALPLAATAEAPQTAHTDVPGTLLVPAAPEGDETTADNDTDDAENGDQDPRTVNVTHDADGFTIVLTRADAADVVTITFDLANATYTTTYGLGEDANASRASLATTFDALVEYSDDNGNGMYDDGEPIRSSYALANTQDADAFPAIGTFTGEVRWDEPVVEDIETDGASGQKIVTTAHFGPLGNGTLSLTTYVFGDHVVLDGHRLAPTSAKVDLAIQDYPFILGDTALALLMDSDSEATTGFGKDHAGMADHQAGVTTEDAFEHLDVDLVYAWSDNATVDNESVQVKTTLLDDNTTDEENATDDNATQEGRFALSYPRGDAIVHAHEAYVTTAAVEDDGLIGESPGVGPVLTLVGVAAVALVGAALRRRDL